MFSCETLGIQCRLLYLIMGVKLTAQGVEVSIFYNADVTGVAE